MSQTSQHGHTQSGTTEARSVGGLLVFAMLPVMMIAVLSWPVLVGAFGLGVGTVVASTRLRARMLRTTRGQNAESLALAQ
jgi:hypothetical protein